jgi:hypothetical protein
MTFAELKASVRTELGESGTAFFTDDDIAEAVNEGYAELADGAEFYERFWNIELLEGCMYYDLTTVLPDTFLSPRRAYSVERSTWLQPSDYREKDTGPYRQWELVTGAPQEYLLRGNWWFGVWPKPSVSGGVIRFYGTAIPAALSTSTDEPPFPTEYQHGIIEYALFDLLAQQRETKKALDKWASYKRYEEGLREYASGRQGLARQVSL